MGVFGGNNQPTIRIPRIRSENGRTAEDLLRGEIRAWASWKQDPARFEAILLATHGLTPLDEPASDEAPTIEPAPEPEADPIEHGTTRGARKHRERDEALCDACWGAARLADRKYKAANRAARAAQ